MMTSCDYRPFIMKASMQSLVHFSLWLAAIMEEKQPLFSGTMERNVVILGKVGTGKRSLGNHIVGQDIFPRESSLGARNANCHYTEQRRGDWLYRVLTVNMTSLSTGYCDPLPYIRERFDRIHLILFAIARGRYTNECHKSLMCAVQNFHQRAKPFCALVITHCEGMSIENRHCIVAEFKSNSASSEVAALFEKGILTVGFPDITILPPNLKQSYMKEIMEDENEIRQLVKDCMHPCSVKNAQPSFIRGWFESIRDFGAPICGSFRDLIHDCWEWCRRCSKIDCFEICFVVFIPCFLLYHVILSSAEKVRRLQMSMHPYRVNE